MHRLYEQEDIAIFWDSEKCRHAKRCVTGSPRTFDITRRPWIDPTKAPTAEIWQAVSACPSGALTCVYTHGIRIVLDEEGHRSIALDGEKQIGECDFDETEDCVEIFHTEVLPEYGRKGIAKRLVYKVTEAAEHAKKRVLSSCSYAKKVLE
ncbi:MAG: GNAT family N-acetyltransferase [Lachnospiraceae bacterium]|nr:GNAT family N-acetyltransferase [Lachnospiraceae bacterium]